MCKICEDLINLPLTDQDDYVEIKIKDEDKTILNKSRYWSIGKYKDIESLEIVYYLLITNGSSELSIHINYCPFCGRKL